MANKLKYGEETVLFAKKVPKSKLAAITKIVADFLKACEVKKMPEKKLLNAGQSGDRFPADKKKPAATIQVSIKNNCDCFLDNGLLKRGKSGCKLPKNQHKF